MTSVLLVCLYFNNYQYCYSETFRNVRLEGYVGIINRVFRKIYYYCYYYCYYY